MNQYIAGTLVRCSVAFTNLAGAPVDPTTVTAFIEYPDDTEQVLTVAHDGTGLYHADVDTTGGMQGVWEFEFSGTGAAEAASVGRFYVTGLGS